ncbi:MAG: hypothetical protein RL701_7173 [Pseudomonadota bacterium]
MDFLHFTSTSVNSPMRCLAISVTCALAVSWIAACGSETAGKLVTVTWQFDQNSTGENADFTTATGYAVHLDEALLNVAAAYAYAPASATQSAVAWLSHWGVSVAHAHGGLDAESGRKVLAEWPMSEGAAVVDALASNTLKLQSSSAEAGTVAAVKLELAASATGPQAQLHGGSMFVRGRAERDDVRMAFAATVALEAALEARSIDLTSLDEPLDADAVLHVAVHPAVWFQHCEFAELPTATTDDAVDVAADTQVGRALVIGVRSPEAFDFHITTNE